MRHRLLRPQAVPGDAPRPALTPPPPLRRWQHRPAWRARRRRRRLGGSRVAGSRRGGSFVGLHRPLRLRDRRADVATPETACTRLIHAWFPQAAVRDKGLLES
jgi:hypothetical protein